MARQESLAGADVLQSRFQRPASAALCAGHWQSDTAQAAQLSAGAEDRAAREGQIKASSAAVQARGARRLRRARAENMHSRMELNARRLGGGGRGVSAEMAPMHAIVRFQWVQRREKGFAVGPCWKANCFDASQL